MGTHGASGFEEMFIGSNAHKVVNIAPCPVLSIRVDTHKVGFSNIIVPLTNDLHSRQKINNAIEFASKYGSTIHLLGLLESDDAADARKFEIKMESVEHLLTKANIMFTKRYIHAKNPAAETMKFADEVRGDLIIIMTDHESELTGIFLGTVAKQVVNHAKTPVLSIRPLKSDIEFDPSGGTGVLI
jgi:nucleotide-binding universal stress UspA family protein